MVKIKVVQIIKSYKANIECRVMDIFRLKSRFLVVIRRFFGKIYYELYVVHSR